MTRPSRSRNLAIVEPRPKQGVWRSGTDPSLARISERDRDSRRAQRARVPCRTFALRFSGAKARSAATLTRP
jgi:hypothetical protein